MGTLAIMYTVLQNVILNHSNIFWKVYLAIFTLIFFSNSESRKVFASICDILSLKFTKLRNFCLLEMALILIIVISFNYLRMTYMFINYAFLGEKDQTKLKYRTKIFSQTVVLL